MHGKLLRALGEDGVSSSAVILNLVLCLKDDCTMADGSKMLLLSF